MRFYLSLVLKNLLRHKKRTFITAISIAAGIWAYVFMDSMVQGMIYDQTFNLVEYETSTVRIITPGYWEDREFFPLDQSIPDPAPVLDLMADEKIPAVPRIRFMAELLYYFDPFPRDGSRLISIEAVDPESDFEVFRIRDAVSRGDWLEPGLPQIILGAGIAEKIGAEPGFPLLIKTRTSDGAYQTMDLVVQGIVDTPNPYVDLFAAYIPLDIADRMLVMNGAVTDINLRFPPKTDPSAARDMVQELLPEGFLAKSWEDIEPLTSELATVANTETQAFTFFIFIIAMVGISNTMLNSVYERFKEIGMLRAMGMDDRNILFSLVLEAAGIGLLGGILGIMLSIPSNWYLIEQGIDFSMFMGNLAFGFRFDPVFRGLWNPETMALSVALGIIVSGLVAIIPARRALKRKVVDCLHFE
jgi:putative ABC transport system permease protein